MKAQNQDLEKFFSLWNTGLPSRPYLQAPLPRWLVIIVNSGCPNEGPQMGPGTGEINGLPILEAGRPRSRYQPKQGWFPLRLLSLAWPSSPCPHMVLLCGCLCPNLFLQGHQQYWIRAYPCVHLFPCIKDSPVSQHSYTLKCWGLAFQHMHWGVSAQPLKPAFSFPLNSSPPQVSCWNLPARRDLLGS